MEKVKIPRLPGPGSPAVWDYRWESYKTPNFEKLKAEGKDLPNHPHTFETARMMCPPVPKPNGDMYSEFDISGFHYMYDACKAGTLGSAGKAVKSDEIASLIRCVDNDLRAKIRQEVANVPEIVAEARKSIGMVGSIVRDIFGMMKDLLRGQPQRAVNLLIRGNESRRGGLSQGLANRWLEFSFGVKPLYQDAKAIAKDVVSRLNDPQNREITANVFQVRNIVGDAYMKPPVGQSYPWYKAAVQCVVKAEAEYVYRIDNPVTAAASAYQLDDPLSLAWELVPLSFVVDWFVPIGEYLSSIRDVKGITGIRSFRYLKGKGQIIKSSRVLGVTRYSQTRCEFKYRTLYNSIPEASWTGFDPHYGGLQLTHTLALIRQFLGDKVVDL